MSNQSSSVPVQSAYDGSGLYFQLLRACGWGALLNLGYSQPWDWFLYPFRADIAQERLVQRSINLLQVQPQQQVLDVACGKGKSSFLLAMQHPQASVIGLDMVPMHIELAEAQYGYTRNLQYQVGQAEALPCPDQSVERIHCLEAAFHFDRQRFLQEVKRVLKPGGRVVIVDFMWKNAASRHLLETTEGKLMRQLWQFDDCWSVQEYQDAAAQLGFHQAALLDLSKPVSNMSHKRMQNLVKASLKPAQLKQFCQLHPALHYFSAADWAVLRQYSDAHKPFCEVSCYMALVLEKR
ncbi:MAG: class I SAM-dependent methyltransferase [Elainella sp.]